MITITKDNNNFIFEVNGMHKLWAFTSRLTIPQNHILNAHQDFEALKGWKGWRAPGTSIPFLLTAGTFHINGSMVFWDVSNKEKSIIVDLTDEEYKQLIIEVEDPGEAIRLLSGR